MSVKVDNTITALKPRMEMPEGCGFTLVEYDPPVRLISSRIAEDNEDHDDDDDDQEEDQ